MGVIKTILIGILAVIVLLFVLPFFAGVFMQTSETCGERMPRFTTAHPVHIDDLGWTGSDSMNMMLKSGTAITVTQVNVDWDNGETWTWTGNERIDTEGSSNIAVTGPGLPSGECAKGDVRIQYEAAEGQTETAAGEGSLQGKIP